MAIQPANFLTLPRELIIKIAMELSDSELLDFSRVSKIFQEVLKEYERQLWNGIERPEKKAYLLHRSLFSLDIQTDESRSLLFDFKDIESLQPRISAFLNLIAKVRDRGSVRAVFIADGELEKSIFSPFQQERWRAELNYIRDSSISPTHFIKMRAICLTPQKDTAFISHGINRIIIDNGRIVLSYEYCPQGIARAMDQICLILAQNFT